MCGSAILVFQGNWRPLNCRLSFGTITLPFVDGGKPRDSNENTVRIRTHHRRRKYGLDVMKALEIVARKIVP